MASLQKVKEGKNFVLYTDGKDEFIKLYGRFSYPAFGTPKENKDDETGKVRKSWGGVLLMPKDTHKEAHKELTALIERVKAKVVNEKTGKPGVFVEDQNLFLKDGDKKEDETGHGHWLVSFSESASGKRPMQPTARDRTGQIIKDDDDIDAKFYGGCWGFVLIRPWYFGGKAKNDPKTYPKRISAGVTGVQFFKDDTPFGSSRPDDEDAWGSYEEEGDDGLGSSRSSDSDDDGL